MKIPKEYIINYIVHAISILDIELLEDILYQTSKLCKVTPKISKILYHFESIINHGLGSNDTFFEVIHLNEHLIGSSDPIYSFTANQSRLNFTLEFRFDYRRGLLIDDLYLDEDKESFINILFFGRNIFLSNDYVPF